MKVGRRACRAGLAALAGAAFGFLGTSGAPALAADAGILPTPPAGAAAATPCPTDLTNTLLCTVTGGSSAAPTAAPTAAPAKPASSSTSRTAPAAQAAPKPGTGASSGPLPPVRLAAVAARFQNAPFLQPLLDILAHPSSGQQPDLIHFRLPGTGGGPNGGTAAASRAGGAGSAGGTAGRRAWSALAALLCGLLAGAAAALRTPGGSAAARWVGPRLRRRAAVVRRARVLRTLPQTSTGRRLLAGAVVAALPLVVSAAVAGTGSRHSPAQAAAGRTPAKPSTASPAGAVSASADQQGRALAMGATDASLPVWNRLVEIEMVIAEQQDRLAQQEQQLSRLTGAASSPPATAAPDAASQQQIAALVAMHNQTRSELEQALEAEYALYRAAAVDPAQRQQLISGALEAPIPDARQAVANDLTRLQTQISQEQVIDDARTKLASMGNLDQAQLDAIARHQPFIVPQLAPISQPFGPTDFALEPPLSVGGVFYPHFHTGIDLAGPMDNPIHAAADGVVLVAQASTDGNGNLVGYGNYVVIAHSDGFMTLYGHLDSVAVRAGQVVHQGQIIGKEGSTGWSTGPHLHFEIRHNGQLMDPLPYVRAQLGV